MFLKFISRLKNQTCTKRSGAVTSEEDHLAPGARCCKSRRWSPYTWKPFIFLVSCSACAGGLITNISYPDTTLNPR